MATIISFGSIVLLATAGGTYQFTPGGEGVMLEAVKMPNSESQYVKELDPDFPQHELVLSLWITTANVATTFTKFNTLQAQGIQSLVIPDYGTYPYCFLKEKPKYNAQKKINLPNRGSAGYWIQVTLLFEQTRLS